MISSDELKRVFKKTKSEVTDQQIHAIIQEIDEGGNQIKYSEFISAAIDLRFVVKPQRLQAIFKQLDATNSG